MDMADLMRAAAVVGASDLHLRVGGPPAVRVNGNIRLLDPQIPSLTADHTRHLIYSVLAPEQIQKFETALELDCSLTLPGVAQYRMNVLFTRLGIDACIRVLSSRIPEPEALGLTAEMKQLSVAPRGLVLVTGPTGAGKTTTLACLIEQANRMRAGHIITIEDPIEYIYESRNCIVRQREVGTHTHGFPQALRAALREDPNIILVGEMRDAETISLAVSAAETGHLCFATLHTQDAASSVSRIIDSFPPHQQEQIRSQLAGSLRAVISQQLVARKDGQGRVAIREFLIVTPAVATLIRDNKLHLIPSAMETGAAIGMVPIDRALAHALRMDLIDADTAFLHARNPDQLRVLAGLARR
jgi:twitching motility protein PilT